MGRYRDKAKKDPEIPTSALPDIIFILLFFFMVTTKMKEMTPKVKTNLPEVSELTKLPKDKQKLTILIGAPKDAGSYGAGVRIQVNDEFIKANEIPRAVDETLAKMDPTKRRESNIIAFIKADRGIKMFEINKVKKQLRNLGVFNVNYSATDKF